MNKAIGASGKDPNLLLKVKKWHRVRVVPQVADTDYGGGIYHGKYFALYNQARDIFLDDIGVSYFSLMKQGINLSIAELHSTYLKPVFYGDTIMVDTRVAWMRNKSFGVIQKMIHIDPTDQIELLKNEVELNLVCTNNKGESVRIPQKLKAAIEKYCGISP